jgi:uncharacterized membrane protein YeaQ/YmgE (transglycosylase-associated protein family)
LPDEPSVLTFLGIRLPDMLAGLAGGVVNAFLFKRLDPWSVVGSIVVGTLTANYLGSSIGKILDPVLGSFSPGSGGSAFIVGLTSMAICQSIMDAVRHWRPPRPPGGTAAG